MEVELEQLAVDLDPTSPDAPTLTDDQRAKLRDIVAEVDHVTHKWAEHAYTLRGVAGPAADD